MLSANNSKLFANLEKILSFKDEEIFCSFATTTEISSIITLKNANKQTLLDIAAANKLKKVVTYLLKDCDGYSNKGINSAFYYAIKTQDLDFIKFLFELDLDEKMLIDATSLVFDDQTSLGLAIEIGNVEIVDYLLEELEYDLNLNTTELGKWPPLLMASHFGHLAIIKVFLKVYKANINLTTADNTTALYLATEQNHLDVIEYLLKHGADLEHRVLEIAINNDDLDLLNTLINSFISYVSIESQAAKEKINHTIYLAIQANKLNLVKYLFTNAKSLVDFTMLFNNLTLLAFASKIGNLEIVECLLEHGANPNQELGWPPLLIAANCGHLHIIELFVKNYGVDINQANQHGTTALYMAAQNEYLPIVEYLLSHGADPYKGYRNNTVFTLAASHEYVDILAALFKSLNVTIPPNDLGPWRTVLSPLTSSNIDAPLLLRTYLTENQLIPQPFEETHYVKFFISYFKKLSYAINQPDDNGETTLNKIAKAGHFKIASFLIKNGANPNLKNTQGESFWDIATANPEFRHSALYLYGLAIGHGFILNLPHDISQQEGPNCLYDGVAYCGKIKFYQNPTLFNKPPLEARKRSSFPKALTSLREKRKILNIPLDGPVFKNLYLHSLIKEIGCERVSFEFANGDTKDFEYFLFIIKESLKNNHPIIIPFSTDLIKFDPNKSHWATIIGWYIDKVGRTHLITAEHGGCKEYLAEKLFESFYKTTGAISVIYPAKSKTGNWWYYKNAKVVEQLKKIDPNIKTKEPVKYSDHENLQFFGKTLTVVLSPGDDPENYKSSIDAAMQKNSKASNS